jgi:hypothetical protein
MLFSIFCIVFNIYWFLISFNNFMTLILTNNLLNKIFLDWVNLIAYCLLSDDSNLFSIRSINSGLVWLCINEVNMRVKPFESRGIIFLNSSYLSTKYSENICKKYLFPLSNWVISSNVKWTVFSIKYKLSIFLINFLFIFLSIILIINLKFIIIVHIIFFILIIKISILTHCISIYNYNN